MTKGFKNKQLTPVDWLVPRCCHLESLGSLTSGSKQVFCNSRSHTGYGEGRWGPVCTLSSRHQPPSLSPRLLCSWALWICTRLSAEGEQLTAYPQSRSSCQIKNVLSCGITWTKCSQAQGSVIQPFPKPPCRRKGRSKRNRNYSSHLKRKMEVISIESFPNPPYPFTLLYSKSSSPGKPTKSLVRNLKILIQAISQWNLTSPLMFSTQTQ